MEVHHHPDLDQKKKNFKEYFLEFLMIFLAVTLGFFAEGLREHLVNIDKEKILMKSMLKDLEEDTVFFSQMSKGISAYNSHLDSLIPLIKNNNNWDSSAKDIYQQQVWLYLYFK